MSARALLAAVIACGCSTGTAVVREVPQAARHVEREIVTKPLPPPNFPTFHVVARGLPGGLKKPTPMTLCPADNAIFMCGGDQIVILRGRDLVADDTLAAGLPKKDGRIDGVVRWVSGRFPDDLWLELATAGEPSIYRYREGRWALAFKPPPVGHSLGYSLSILRMGDKPLYWTSDFESPVRFFAPNGGDRPKDGLFCGQGFVFTFGADLLTDGADCATSVPHLKRWTKGGASEVIPYPNEGGMFGYSIYDGQLLAYDFLAESPRLSRLDGKQWHTIDTPGVVGRMHRYERIANVEWIFADGLYRRPPGATTFAKLALPDDVRDYWITGDNDLWVFRRAGNDGELLRTIAPTREARFDWH